MKRFMSSMSALRLQSGRVRSAPGPRSTRRICRGGPVCPPFCRVNSPLLIHLGNTTPLLGKSVRDPLMERLGFMPKYGIMTFQAFKDRVMRISRGFYKPKADEPKIWFESLNAAAQVLDDEEMRRLKIFDENHSD